MLQRQTKAVKRKFKGGKFRLASLLRGGDGNSRKQLVTWPPRAGSREVNAGAQTVLSFQIRK